MGRKLYNSTSTKERAFGNLQWAEGISPTKISISGLREIDGSLVDRDKIPVPGLQWVVADLQKLDFVQIFSRSSLTDYFFTH